MQIRKSQMDVFEQRADSAFLVEVIEHLRGHHAELVSPLPEALLRIRAYRAIERGRDCGLVSRSALTAFVALSFVFGPRFHEQEFIHSVLTDQSIDPDERVGLLMQLSTERDWEEAAEIRADSPWTE
jgi:hypothetical protein